MLRVDVFIKSRFRTQVTLIFEVVKLEINSGVQTTGSVVDIKLRLITHISTDVLSRNQGGELSQFVQHNYLNL